MKVQSHVADLLLVKIFSKIIQQSVVEVALVWVDEPGIETDPLFTAIDNLLEVVLVCVVGWVGG